MVIDERNTKMNIDANVQKIVFALIRKWKLLVIFAVIGCLLGYFYTANFTTLTYTSSVTFFTFAVDSQQELTDSIQTSGNSNDSVRTSNTSKMNYAQKMLPTYIEIFKTNEFNQTVANELNQRVNANYSMNTIKSAVQYETIEDTSMFTVKITTSNSDLSYEIAKQLEKTIPETLLNRNSGLVHASVEDKALKANAAESLGYPKKMALGAAIGIVIAAAYIILRSFLDVRIRTDEELIDMYNIPVLGSIPNFSQKPTQATAAKVYKQKKGADGLNG